MFVASHPDNWTSGRPYSPAVVVGRTVYVSGHVPVDRDGRTVGSDTRDQTEQVLRNIERTLSSCGLTMADVVATTVYLTDITTMSGLDEAYRSFLAATSFPTRTTVEVSALGRADFQVEISAIACGGGGTDS